MKKPNGYDLLALLIDLYADQEGVRITYEFSDSVDNSVENYPQLRGAS